MEKAILATEPRNVDLKGFERVYIGNEFCQNLIPAPELLKRRIEFVKENNLDYSIVTPYVTEYGLRKLKELFKVLKGDEEIIVNDLGVLSFLQREHPEFKLVLGRVVSHNLMKNALNMEINSTPSFDFFNIERLETSNKGSKMSFVLNHKLKISLYYPYLFLSTGRRCMYGFKQFVVKEDFVPINCGIKCRNAKHKIANKYVHNEILIIGNSHFMEIKDLPESLSCIDRLVYMPENFFSI